MKQKRILDKHFNAYRFCYNLCLEYKTLLWKFYKINVNGFDMQSELFEILRQTPWLSECKVECLRESAHNVNKAFIRFYKGNNFPKFKKKGYSESFTAYQALNCKSGKLKFFGNSIRFKSSDKDVVLLKSTKIKNVTFKKDRAGDYWAACLIENKRESILPPANEIIGIDLGLKDLLITSNGIKYANNRYLQSTAFKIANMQRKFSRTQKGSSNRNKLRIKIAKLFSKAYRQREHYYHQITNELIRDNQTIVLETLKIKNMVQNQKLARSISDASWGLIVKQLEYKAIWHRRTIIRLSSFYPSTKTCSNCGCVKDMPLTERVYNCECGLSLDRDINAAINIRNAGLKIPGVPVEGVGYEPIEAGSNNLINRIINN